MTAFFLHRLFPGDNASGAQSGLSPRTHWPVGVANTPAGLNTGGVQTMGVSATITVTPGSGTLGGYPDAPTGGGFSAPLLTDAIC